MNQSGDCCVCASPRLVMSLTRTSKRKQSATDPDWSSEKKRKKKEQTNLKHASMVVASKRSAAGSNGRAVKKGEVLAQMSREKCLSWFKQYSGGESEEEVCPEGMERFCRDLGVEPEDSVMLVIAWHMGAARMGYFTQAEWMTGMEKMGCDSMDKLKSKLGQLREQLQVLSSFKEIYRYAFDFAREKDQRCLDLETAKALLHLLLSTRWPLLLHFQDYLTHQVQYRVINRDQWYNIHEFTQVVKSDLSNYDPNGAWPVLLDEFVEWMSTQEESTCTDVN